MIQQLAEFRDEQLALWPLARENYHSLGYTLRRPFHIGSLEGVFQFNPARAVSTGAKLDKASIDARPCFLCKGNRPEVQFVEEIIPGWEFLVNPYPIFPLHFTIAFKRHEPQDALPLEMASMAEKLSGMTVFFNGARAGASAPDHLHCQTVMTSELPLMRYLEHGGDPGTLPFKVDYRRITPDAAGLRALADLRALKGTNALTGLPDPRLINAYMWIGNDGVLRSCVIFRRAHRPASYVSDGSSGFMVSPGAIDMAGVMVLPRKIDYETITGSDAAVIYSDVALTV